MNNIALIDFRDMTEPLWLENLKKFAEKAMDKLELSNWELSILLCGEEFIASLNKEYRQKDGPTDVLSFLFGEQQESETGLRYIAGDVIICLSIMKQNAEKFEVTEDDELKRLIVHGILHLNGMDHSTNDSNEVMLIKQEELLAQLAQERIL